MVPPVGFIVPDAVLEVAQDLQEIDRLAAAVNPLQYRSANVRHFLDESPVIPAMGIALAVYLIVMVMFLMLSVILFSVYVCLCRMPKYTLVPSELAVNDRGDGQEFKNQREETDEGCADYDLREKLAQP